MAIGIKIGITSFATDFDEITSVCGRTGYLTKIDRAG